MSETERNESMYYSEFVKVDDKDAALLHDEDGVMYVGVVANEFDKIEYLTAAEIRKLADKLEQTA